MLRAGRTLRQPMVNLLLTPPSQLFLPSSATDEFFRTLHELLKPIRLYDKSIGYVARISLEIVATKEDGIRYVLCTPEEQAATVEQLIAGYLPETKVSRVEDPLTIGRAKPLYHRFKQKLHYAYPLQTAEQLHEHDPISYLTNAMTKLEVGELMAMQLIIQPVARAEIRKLSNQIRRNEDILPGLSGKPKLGFWIMRRVSDLSIGLLDIMSGAFSAGHNELYFAANRDISARKSVDSKSKPVRYLSSFEYELVSTIDHKLSQPLFQAELRSIVSVKTKREARERSKSVQAALNLTAIAKYQSLQAKRLIGPIKQWRMQRATLKRLLGLRPVLILSTGELATLYHFPTSSNTKTDNLAASLSRTLAAPVSLKGKASLDILLGENYHHGQLTPIGLTVAERERHVYVVGGTGNGKTTMLLYGIVQDIKSGKGLAVLDPHGDLAETILRHIPEERVNDVIYLNPDDLERPIGINLLELKPGLTGDDLIREKDLITESVISVLRKLFSEDDSGGHRIEYVLRNTIQTALTTNKPTLFTIFRLLNNTRYRQSVVRDLEDEDLKNFWNNELGKAGEYQRVKMAAGITSKIGRFLFSGSARKMLEQEQSSIDFEDILNTGKILICNFSKGVLGEDTSTLFGTTVLAKLQVAALRRAKLPHAERRPYHLYIDEFQNFATMSFVQMLSEARKYKLYLTMAEQSTAQQDQQRLVDIILANVGTVICFRTGSPADEVRLLPLFKPFIKEGELANLPTFSFYARIVAVNSQEPMSGLTILLQDTGSTEAMNSVIAASRRRYGLKLEARTIVTTAVNEKPVKRQARHKRNTTTSNLFVK